MPKVEKQYKITKTQHRTGSTYESTGTLAELVQYYAYTLECGASWQHERGRAKINRNPKTIKGLVTALNNAVNNSAANGYSGVSYVAQDLADTIPLPVEA